MGFITTPICQSEPYWGRLAAGMVQAVSGHSVIGNWRIQFYAISSDDWRRIRTADSVWITGDLIYTQRASHRMTDETCSHFEVRFEPQGVRAIIGSATKAVKTEQPPDGSSSAQNKGGRPRKDWWDDFWIDICRQIYEGDLKPATQADLERAMHDWVSSHSHEAGETTIKNASRKLFKAGNCEVKNQVFDLFCPFESDT